MYDQAKHEAEVRAHVDKIFEPVFDRIDQLFWDQVKISLMISGPIILFLAGFWLYLKWPLF